MNKSNKLNSLIILIIFVSFYGCSREGYLSSSYSTAITLLTNQYLDDKSLIDRELIESIPFASSIISFENKQQSLIILESFKGQENQWISADKIRFLEKKGRITRTIGLPNDLYSIERPDVDFNFLLNQDKYTYYAYYSFRKPDFNYLKVKINTEVIGKKKINILGVSRDVILIRERLFSKKINWSALNEYWIDPVSKFVWKSKQSISPKLPYLEIEITKKPRN